MNGAVVTEVARSIAKSATKTWVFWHGGEPLAAGRKRFEDYMSIFDQENASHLCKHNFQTNATLIDEWWCSFFQTYKIKVGVSLDGDQICNSNRVDWLGRPAFDRAMRGLDRLTKAGIDYSIISVISRLNYLRAHEIYEFIKTVKPRSLSINIEEAEGINSGINRPNSEGVRTFWENLHEAWLDDPILPIRQFTETYGVLDRIYQNDDMVFDRLRYIYPTIDVSGDVTVLSPELMSVSPERRASFVVGNVLEKSLIEILRDAPRAEYVKEFFSGLEKCEKECDYWQFCGGGQASNRFFETGRMDNTETAYCRNSKMAPVEVVLRSLEIA